MTETRHCFSLNSFLTNRCSSFAGLGFSCRCARLWVVVVLYSRVTETFSFRQRNWFDHEWFDVGVFRWYTLLLSLSCPYWLNYGRTAQNVCNFCQKSCFWCLVCLVWVAFLSTVQGGWFILAILFCINNRCALSKRRNFTP